jgi:hypothetical protein
VTERVILRVREFSKTPGPRSPSEGEYSGETFLADWLLPRFIKAREGDTRLLVDLDGVAGYASSFLEAAFGGLARKFGAKEVRAHLDLKSEEDPYLIEEVFQDIDEANEP